MKISKKKIMLILAKKEMTKAELARRAGIARQNISTILSRGTCNQTTAGKIARGLDVDVSEILAEE